ncbi:magnesium chelatase subunit H [Thermogladius sp. 4427co]|uniref:magnesium chelatase subunit H n=1 Tax=Thermogladius sp. 4427co TaxID=3450718 RepID=UPI003F78F276
MRVGESGVVNLCVISTKTNLSTLVEAVEDVNKQLGSIRLRLSLFYTHILDEAGEEERKSLYEALEKSDIILIDVRTPSSWFVKEIGKHVGRARVVVPLVGGSPDILGLLKLGEFRAGFLDKAFRELDMDVEYVDMSRVFKIIDLTDKAARILPLGPFKHLRNWILCTRYWSLNGKENLKNMLLLLLNNYFGLNVAYEEPRQEILSYMVWNPLRDSFIELSEYMRQLDSSKPTVLVLMYSGMHFYDCKPVAKTLFNELTKRGVNAILLTGAGSNDLVNQSKGLLKLFKESNAKFDLLVNLQWFFINGGPYGGPHEPTYELMEFLNCPLVNGLIMYMREVSKWEKDPRGLSPIEVLTAVALPETDGSIEPIPLAGLSDDIGKSILPIRDRLERRADRIVKWIELRRKKPRDRRIAVIIYNYPPGEHNVGSAAYLDIFSSLEALLRALKDSGYSVNALSRDELKKIIVLNGLINSPQYVDRGRNTIKLGFGEYLKYFQSLPGEVRKKIVDTWGPPPGTINVAEDGIVIPGIVLGNVFIGVQPSRGVHEDPSKIYHSKDLPPHHQYLAFYYWVRNVFKADAIIHLGTHGTLEFLPGKEVGLSSKCFPDILLGDLPNIYVYHVTNPSEMSIAKRRGYAYIVTHGTPPFTTAGLYGDYIELEELVHEYREALLQDPERARIVLDMIREKSAKLNIEFSSVDDLEEKLFEFKRSIIPRGLHVLGGRWGREEVIEYLALIARYDWDEARSLYRILAGARGLDYDKLLENPSSVVSPGLTASKILEELDSEIRRIIEGIVNGRSIKELGVKNLPKHLAREFREAVSYLSNLYRRIMESDEIRSILRALNGEYLRPRVAGDPIRTPEVFPVGSNGYAFDPRLVPSKAALKRGGEIAEEVVASYRRNTGQFPETVAVVLWGFETAGTRGETIGEILRLLGVRLVRKHGPWTWDLEVIPLSELGRPRIDVLVTICGIFRDMFPNLITLIDRAVRLVASLDEPPEMNYVRKHVEELKRKGLDKATLRIFGPRPGEYGTRLPGVVETSSWSDSRDLARVYFEDMKYGYGENVEGVELPELFRSLLSKVSLVTQVRYAHEYDIIDLDHYYEFLGGLMKTVELVKGSKVNGVWVDTTGERVKYRGVRKAIEFSVRTRLLNPKWIEGMLAHGYDGVREIAKRVEYVLGLSATTGEVPDWVWKSIVDRYLLDNGLRDRMLRENPWAYYRIVKLVYEAIERGVWKPNGEYISGVTKLLYELSDKISQPNPSR